MADGGIARTGREIARIAHRVDHVHVAQHPEQRVVGQRRPTLVKRAGRRLNAIEARPQLGTVAGSQQDHARRPQLGSRKRQDFLAHLGWQRERRAHFSRSQRMIGSDHAYQLVALRFLHHSFFHETSFRTFLQLTLQALCPQLIE